jgi:hypothetical protein
VRPPTGDPDESTGLGPRQIRGVHAQRGILASTMHHSPRLQRRQSPSRGTDPRRCGPPMGSGLLASGQRTAVLAGCSVRRAFVACHRNTTEQPPEASERGASQVVIAVSPSPVALVSAPVKMEERAFSSALAVGYSKTETGTSSMSMCRPGTANSLPGNPGPPPSWTSNPAAPIARVNEEKSVTGKRTDLRCSADRGPTLPSHLSEIPCTKTGERQGTGFRFLIDRGLSATCRTAGAAGRGSRPCRSPSSRTRSWASSRESRSDAIRSGRA